MIYANSEFFKAWFDFSKNNSNYCNSIDRRQSCFRTRNTSIHLKEIVIIYTRLKFI